MNDDKAQVAATTIVGFELPMPDFEVYLDDDRYSVPSFYLITAANEARAKAMAEELWRTSEHHQGVELRRAGERLFGAGTMGANGRLPPARQQAPSL